MTLYLLLQPEVDRRIQKVQMSTYFVGSSTARVFILPLTCSFFPYILVYFTLGPKGNNGYSTLGNILEQVL